MKINLKSLSMVLIISALAASSVEASRKRSQPVDDEDSQTQEPARTWSEWASQKAAANNPFASQNAKLLANRKLQQGNLAVANQQAEIAKEKADRMAKDAQDRLVDANRKAAEAAELEIERHAKKIKELKRQTSPSTGPRGSARASKQQIQEIPPFKGGVSRSTRADKRAEDDRKRAIALAKSAPFARGRSYEAPN